MKLLLIGYARSGKDTAAEYLRDNFGLSFISSSQAACNIFLFDALKDKYGYQTYRECFDDRINHRQEWFELISEYNKDDKARLAKEILKQSDCYVGMRNKEEIAECRKQGLFDLIIWIDGEQRVGKEDSSSCGVDKTDADIIIDSNGSVKELYLHLERLFRKIDINDEAWMYRNLQ